MMTIIILSLLLLGCLLIATSHLTGVNKSAIAMFVGTVGWVLYVAYGSDFVMMRHPHEYLDFLSGASPTSEAVKHYIYYNVFFTYVGKAAAVVLFLLATMSIIEILDNNGCFDFITEWVRTRNSRRLLWTLTVATFLISANLDNLTTATMMLVVMRTVVRSHRQRMIVGSAIVLAANAGGLFTVIGDPTGVMLWTLGAVTATDFSTYLLLPALVAWIIPTWLMGRQLPDRLDVDWPSAPYRGDDTNLNRWQRLAMLIVGIGGLWFVPTFHNITKLSPFLGALCVLGVLWVADEAVNRKLIATGQITRRSRPRALEYGPIQQILYCLGILLALGAVAETGALEAASEWVDYNIHNVWITGALCGLLSGLVDTFTVAVAHMQMYPIVDAAGLDRWADADYMASFAENGVFWKILPYTTAVGGCLLCFSNVAGLALMKMERIRTAWYFRNVSWTVLTGWIAGFAVLWAETMI